MPTQERSAIVKAERDYVTNRLLQSRGNSMIRYTVNTGEHTSLNADNSEITAIGDGAETLRNAIRRLAAYEDTGLSPDEIMPLAQLMKKFGHGGPDATVMVCDVETQRAVVNGRVYSATEMMRAVDELAAVVKERDDIKAEFEAWKSGKIGVEEYYALKVQLAEVAAQRDELRAKYDEARDCADELLIYGARLPRHVVDRLRRIAEDNA